MGLESEFFVRQPRSAKTDALNDFHRLVTRLSERLPLAPSKSNPFRFFLANGSSVSLEVGGIADVHGALFEIATPECTSPRDLLKYQMANEQLLEEAFAADHSPDHWALVKSNTDGQGHTLGQHESFDMRIAQGPWLIAWWLGLLVLLPAILAYRLLASIWMMTVYAMCGISRGLHFMLHRVLAAIANRTHSAKDTNDGLRPPVHDPFFTAFWMEVAATGLRCLHAPIVWSFACLIRAVALHPQRRALAGFLASRCILDGAGYVDEQSRYWISQRASTINSMIGFGSYGRTKPLFRCDPLLRDLLAGPFHSLHRFLGLFHRRQRIELAIGDSGMCQQAQYLRYGVTSLVLDMVEFGEHKSLPRLLNPVEAVVEYARDWMLIRTVSDLHARQQSAKEVQRAYANACKKWMEDRRDTHREAWQLLDLWQATLNQLILRPKEESSVPMTLVGRVDWISKLWLIQQMDPGAAWEIRKKIDIRYHELSPEGYHRKLSELVQIAPIVRDDELERARRGPPGDSPAQRRGNLIREFADSSSDLRVDWRSASYELEGTRYRIDF